MANLRCCIHRAIQAYLGAYNFSGTVSQVHCERALGPAGSSPSAGNSNQSLDRACGWGRALIPAIAPPPPGPAEHRGIICGPDPLVLVGFLQRPILRRRQLADVGLLTRADHDRGGEDILVVTARI